MKQKLINSLCYSLIVCLMATGFAVPEHAHAATGNFVVKHYKCSGCGAEGATGGEHDITTVSGYKCNSCGAESGSAGTHTTTTTNGYRCNGCGDIRSYSGAHENRYISNYSCSGCGNTSNSGGSHTVEYNGGYFCDTCGQRNSYGGGHTINCGKAYTFRKSSTKKDDCSSCNSKGAVTIETLTAFCSEHGNAGSTERVICDNCRLLSDGTTTYGTCSSRATCGTFVAKNVTETCGTYTANYDYYTCGMYVGNTITTTCGTYVEGTTETTCGTYTAVYMCDNCGSEGTAAGTHTCSIDDGTDNGSNDNTSSGDSGSDGGNVDSGNSGMTGGNTGSESGSSGSASGSTGNTGSESGSSGSASGSTGSTGSGNNSGSHTIVVVPVVVNKDGVHNITFEVNGETYNMNITVNGGTLDTSQIEIVDNEYVVLPKISKEGKTLEGWYMDGKKIEGNVELQEVIDLTAKWQSAPEKVTAVTTKERNGVYNITFEVDGETYNVQLATNGGVLKQTTYVEIIDNKYLSLPEINKNGYELKGWYQDGKKLDNKVVDLKKIMKVSAQWRGKSIVVEYNANGGKLKDTLKNKINGDKFGKLPTPTRSGYKFVGWYTKKTGGKKVTKTTVISAGSDKKVKIYARWKVIKVTKLAVKYGTYTVKVGNEKTIGLNVKPANALKNLVYTSSNKAIATISNKGIVTAKRKGAVVITIKDKLTGKKVTCLVVVKKKR